MQLTKELLQSRLRDLQEQHARLQENFHAVTGGIQVLTHLLGLLDAPEPPVKPSNLVEMSHPQATEGEPG